MKNFHFKSNARHQFTNLIIGRFHNGSEGISNIFNANIWINENGLLESIRLYERDKALDITEAGIYDAIADTWCYPKSAGNITKPSNNFRRLSHGFVQAVDQGFLPFEGNLQQGLAAIMTDARKYVRSLEPDTGKMCVFAGPPQILGK